MKKSIYPKARKRDQLTSKVNDETIIYDTEINKASCLNELATAVWKVCDGKSDTRSILVTIRNAGYQDATEQIILMAIDQLDQAGLLEESFEIDERDRKSLNRREMLRLLGAAAVLPVVSTIDIRPAFAQSSIPLLGTGEPCSSSTQCQSGICCSQTHSGHPHAPICYPSCHSQGHIRP